MIQKKTGSELANEMINENADPVNVFLNKYKTKINELYNKHNHPWPYGFESSEFVDDVRTDPVLYRALRNVRAKKMAASDSDVRAHKIIEELESDPNFFMPYEGRDVKELIKEIDLEDKKRMANFKRSLSHHQKNKTGGEALEKAYKYYDNTFKK